MEIRRGDVDAVEAVLLEGELTAWSVFEDVLAGRAWLIGVFDCDDAAREGWRVIRGQLRQRVRGAVEFRVLADVDWRESYKAHFKPWRCGSLHWVPEWERATYAVPRGHAAVYLDPGLAFGTGNHETTRLCCRRLVEFAVALPPRRRRNWRVIDAGCGSGILAVSAAKLGCRRVVAFDSDPEAVRVARENTRSNRAASAVRVGVGGLGEMLRRRRAELVLANIQADVLMAHARELLGAVSPGGTLVLSGILEAELATTRATFRCAAESGWRLQSRQLGEWADLVCHAP